MYSGTNPDEAVTSSTAFMNYIIKNPNVHCILTTHFIKVCKKLQKNKNIINCHMETEKKDNMLKNKVLLITGGTGSFGNAVLNRFLNTEIKEIRIFSRDEKKQDDMRHHIQNPKVKFYIGDVRDKRSVDAAMVDVDYVFHAAALKQVPSCEFFPMQAVNTNILGTDNVLDSAIQFGVKNVVVLSTDKACYPINSMGISILHVPILEQEILHT